MATLFEKINVKPCLRTVPRFSKRRRIRKALRKIGNSSGCENCFFFIFNQTDHVWIEFNDKIHWSFPSFDVRMFFIRVARIPWTFFMQFFRLLKFCLFSTQLPSSTKLLLNSRDTLERIKTTKLRSSAWFLSSLFPVPRVTEASLVSKIPLKSDYCIFPAVFFKLLHNCWWLSLYQTFKSYCKITFDRRLNCFFLDSCDVIIFQTKKFSILLKLYFHQM